MIGKGDDSACSRNYLLDRQIANIDIRSVIVWVAMSLLEIQAIIARILHANRKGEMFDKISLTRAIFLVELILEMER